ncbi:MAG TPA: LLM class flavin-dependent oxidoreductase [Acidimicrobiales bacterium]|nr:LLM class flavin-dependent oxidoreductase [Acidimicrobiales bacterium]
MKIGVTLPQFRDEGESAIAAARRAEEAGLDGVFVFDHLWPMGSPDRPIISALPLLGALVAETESIHLGSLVMRVGLVPDPVLIEQLVALAGMSGGRTIAGLGTGDHMSAAENLAFGVPYPPAADRRASLEACASALLAQGVPVWIGAGAGVRPATRALAVRTGAVLNVWHEEGMPTLDPDDEVEQTWAGPLKGSAGELAAQLARLRDAGASWAVCAWPGSLEDVAEAAAVVRRG